MPPNEWRGKLRGLGVGKTLPFFLHVGGNQWYKNRPGVVRIFAHLVAFPQFADHHLVMVGKPWTEELCDAIKRAGLSGRVHELAGVSNQELQALYSAAEALVFPSMQEGFGWPIAEAQACGCPVFTTNRPPMTEVGGDAAVYFDPEDTGSAAHLVAEGIAERTTLVQRGLKNATRFSAEAMSNGYLAAIEQVVKERASGG